MPPTRATMSGVLESVLRLADRALEDQQRLAADEYADVLAMWKGIDREVSQLDSILERLLRTTKSGTA